jgi:hypothetical protein
MLAVRISDSMVLRIDDRNEDEEVRGRSGNRTFRSLERISQSWIVKRKIEDMNVLYRRDYRLIPQHDQVLYKCFSRVGRQSRIMLKK